MTLNITREQLYDLVWSEPMRTLAKRIGISDVAIAKHCRKSDVPVPERGYWNKLQAGKKVVRAELMQADLGTINRIHMSGSLTPELLARIKGEPGVPDTECESVDVLAERFRKRLGKVVAQRNFSTVHPAIATLLRKDEELRQKYAGSPYSSWYQPRFDSPFERRRLRVLNGIFLGVAKVGGDAWTRGDTARELGLKVGDRSISFELDHPAAKRGRTAPPPNKKDAKLCLNVANQDMPAGVVAQWEDNEGRPLEDQLAEVIVGLAIAAEYLQRAWVEQQKAWERELRERQARAEREKRERDARLERDRLAAIEKAKLDSLLQDAENMRRAADIRAYVEAVRIATAQASAGNFDNWSRWALSEADKLDPIASGRAISNIHLTSKQLGA